MRRVVLACLAAVLASACLGARAAAPADGIVSPAHPEVQWEGGPLTGVSTDAANCPTSCDEFGVRVDIPDGYWKRAPGGVVVRIEWADANDEFDLVVYDAKGEIVGTGIEFHTRSEQVLLPEAAGGEYRIVAHGFAVTAATYHGSVRLDRALTPGVGSLPSTMRFASPTLVDPQMWVAMPSLWAARDGAVFVTAPWGLSSTTSFVWRSADNGATFELLDDRIASVAVDPRRRPCSLSSGGGDTDIVVDRTGRVYQSDAEAANVAVAVSENGGDTWRCNAVAASMPEQDRPWLAPAPGADGMGPNDDAYLAYRDLASGGLPVAEKVKPLQLHLDATTNGGLTWEARGTTAAGMVGSTGPLFSAPDGTLYQVFQSITSVWIARYDDGGRTPTLTEVSRRFGSPANIWMAGDVDEAGNVYIAWAEGGQFDILYSYSRDRGLHWSEPKRVSPPQSETVVMPWLAAGRAGDVAIAWYGTASKRHPEEASDARWYTWVARSPNAAAPAAAFETARLSETPTHFGALCLEGVTCTDRRFGEFFEIDIASDGALVAVFDDNGRIQHTTDGVSPGPYVTFMRQISGLGMRVTAAALPVERAGDARFPVRSATAQPTDQLDLTALPALSGTGDVLKLRLDLASAKDLAVAVEAAGTVLATEAKWVVVWKANDRVEYAGMRVDREGVVSFFGGDEPVGVARPEPNTPNNKVEKLASYPATFSLNGSVDEATGAVTIDIPRARYHLKPGDVLHGLQAFSMTGLLEQPTFLTSNLVLDSTPARTVTLAGGPAAAVKDARGSHATGALPATGSGDPALGLVLLAGAAIAWTAGRERRAGPAR